LLSDAEYFVPIILIAESTPNHITLHGMKNVVAQLNLFRTANFIPAANLGSEGTYLAFYWPFQVSGAEFIKFRRRDLL